MYTIKEGLSYDDVLLIPKHSKIKSRSEVDLSVKINDFIFNHPIIPANMKTIIGEKMALEIYLNGGMGLMHRFLPIDVQIKSIVDIVKSLGKYDVFDYIGFSVGIHKEDRENMKKIFSVGGRIICIDIAHGDSQNCISMIKWIKKNYPDVLLIAGNVATGSGAENLWLAGTDVVKVNVGAGSTCSTRIETGNGVPQLTALMDVYESYEALKSKLNRNIYIISDGGAKNVGDLVKSLCFSHMVMTGNMFAGCNETPTNFIHIGDKMYKEYVGSSTHKKKHIEGVSALVKAKGSFNDILQKMLEGIRSGCSYQGVSDLTKLRNFPQFVKMTNSGLIESKPHDIIMV